MSDLLVVPVSSFVKCQLSPPAKVLLRTLPELENAGLRVLAGCVNPCWPSCSSPDWASGFPAAYQQVSV